MNTNKPIRSEYTASTLMQNAPTVKIGANFAKPIPRNVRAAKPSFFDKFLRK